MAVKHKKQPAQEKRKEENITESEIKAAESISAKPAETKAPEQGAFDKLSRSINEDDLKNPVVARMLLSNIDILNKEKNELTGFRSKFYDSDKQCAVLENKAKGESKFQTLYSFTLSIGGIVFGISFTTKDWVFLVLLICGICLLFIGVALSYLINKK